MYCFEIRFCHWNDLAFIFTARIQSNMIYLKFFWMIYFFHDQRFASKTVEQSGILNSVVVGLRIITGPMASEGIYL